MNIPEVYLHQNIASLELLRSEMVLVVTLLIILVIDLFLTNEKLAFKINTGVVLIANTIIFLLSLTEFSNTLFGPFSLFYTKIGYHTQGEIINLSEAMLTLTKQGSFFKLLMTLCVYLLLIFNNLEFKMNSKFEKKTEYYVAIIAVLIGSFFMLSASHLLSLLLAIEISSFGAYALIYFQDSKQSKEATIKFLIYGLMATGIMLFGMSILYLEIGSLSYNAFISSLMVNDSTSIILITGTALMLMGLLFKLGAIPMYFWVPDAFEGGPTSSIAFLSLVPKFGALGSLILLFSYVPQVHFGFFSIQELMLIIGVITMTLGNFLALGQHDFKRLMAYSSIAHAGFLIVALGIWGNSGLNSLCFYSLVYIFMNFTVFIGGEYFASQTKNYNIKSWSGLGASSPFWAIIITVSVVALIGIPPTAGFNAKLFVFSSLLEVYSETNNSLILFVLVIGVFNLVISLFYYLKLPFYLFFQKSEEVLPDKTSVLSKLQVFLVALPLIIFFLFSGQIIDWIKKVNDIVKYFVQ